MISRVVIKASSRDLCQNVSAGNALVSILQETYIRFSLAFLVMNDNALTVNAAYLCSSVPKFQNDVSRKLIVLFLSHQNATKAIDEILPKLDEPRASLGKFSNVTGTINP